MEIIDLAAEHMGQALSIVRHGCEAERQAVPALPPVDEWPDLAGFADNGLGVAAFDGRRMVGFLGAWGPFEHAFGSTDAVGVFSPMHGNGVVGDHRAAVFARLYQAAATKWARAGAASHGICLYAHDEAAQAQFFRYGFGLRCIDAIRPMDELVAAPCPGVTFCELRGDDRLRAYPLDVLLDEHMAASPTFIRRPTLSRDEFAARLSNTPARYFAARVDDGEGEVIAFLKTEAGAGETFIIATPGYQHINGAYCLPEYRGRGIYRGLLAHVIHELKGENWPLLGVDFESINPTANGFWLKHFSAYTHSVVRRIDEHSLAR